MTPFDAAIQRAARALHRSLGSGPIGDWDQMTSEMQERYIQRARVTVNAFNDALKEQNS